MEERIVTFIAALRAAGVRISLAESVDALNAIAAIGIKQRRRFRLAMRAALIKDAADIETYNEYFDIYFGSGHRPPMMDIEGQLSPDEADMLAQALRQVNQQLRQMLEKLITGEPLTPQQLERLAKMVGLTQMDNLRYREWMMERMKKALRFREVLEAMRELANLLDQLGMNKQRIEQLSQMMGANQQALEQQLRQYSGQRIAENMGRQPPQRGNDDLLTRPFGSLSERDMERLRVEVQRLAAILKTRVALRQKRAKSGQLDAKATIRANLKNGNVPIEIKHRERSLKPKLVVLCDISTSMRFCSELMLSLLYALQDQISKTQAFAYIDHLESISQHFASRSAKDAVARVLEQLPSGYYNTDLGNSLDNFQRDYLNKVDSRTTFIIVGDGRNNYNNPRLDIFKQLARRSRRTIWINPETPALWGSGDSDMLDYAPACNIVLKAASMQELTQAVDRLLTH